MKETPRIASGARPAPFLPALVASVATLLAAGFFQPAEAQAQVKIKPPPDVGKIDLAAREIGEMREKRPKRLAPPEGQVYRWRDGDRTMEVFLQADLVVRPRGESAASGVAAPDIEVANAGGGSIVRVAAASRTDAAGQAETKELPVFRAPSGALMTLPGGALVVLERSWTRNQVEAFFAEVGIGLERVSPLGELPNGFVVSTDPGFPSMELANALATAPGVVVSSPNWWVEHERK